MTLLDVRFQYSKHVASNYFNSIILILGDEVFAISLMNHAAALCAAEARVPGGEMKIQEPKP